VAQAICIWTSSGWRCVSSPVKVHYAGKKACKVLPAAQGLPTEITRPVAALLRKNKLAGVDPNVVAKVVGLMVTARVGRNTPFTIIKAP
jgi:hypothetical protein